MLSTPGCDGPRLQQPQLFSLERPLKVLRRAEELLNSGSHAKSAAVSVADRTRALTTSCGTATVRLPHLPGTTAVIVVLLAIRCVVMRPDARSTVTESGIPVPSTTD